MFDSHAFYKKRLSEHLKETSRYLKYVFNEHIAIVMLFLISALAFYYQQWLAQLPEEFPGTLVIGVAFGLVVSYSPVRTLLKEPDLVFLIVAEDRMKSYFRNSIIYSFVIQLYIVFIVVAALGPLYFSTFPDRTGKIYLYTILALLIFKVWNLLANWWMLKVRNTLIRYTDTVLRIGINCAAFYFLVSGDGLFAGIMTILFIMVFLYDYKLSKKQLGIAWEVLVEKERNSMQAFYRLANMFTDVPHMRNPVKKRTWLVSIVKNVPFTKQYTYDYLYRITFIRSGDYLGMYVRLIIIGSLAIVYVPNLVMKLLFVLLFLYMSSFQMMTLFHHHRTIMWLDIYPVKEHDRKQALIKWLTKLGFIQAILFALIFLTLQLYLGAFIALIGGVAFIYLFVNGYVSRKLD